MQPVYLVVGVSGSGKSWACRQLTHKFHYVPHDRCWKHPTKTPDQNAIDPTWAPGAVSTHFETILSEANRALKPVLTECPFGERPLREKWEACGVTVIPVFVIELPHIVAQRYRNREGKELPAAAFTRATTIRNRADEWKAFAGTSSELLEHLKHLSI